jgi:hypothetical protein
MRKTRKLKKRMSEDVFLMELARKHMSPAAFKMYQIICDWDDLPFLEKDIQWACKKLKVDRETYDELIEEIGAFNMLVLTSFDRIEEQNG